MCLVLLAHAAHPKYAVVIAANRDESHARATARAAWWDEGWLAGRDLAGGGTWLGVTRAGRWAVITNVREPGRNDPAAPSRGALVVRYLGQRGDGGDDLAAIVASGERHNGFNLLAGEDGGAHWGSNRGPAARSLAPGIYGLSNRLLDTPWPKVLRVKAAFADWCRRDGSEDLETAELFAMLHDRTEAPDDDLPSTGLAIERERLVSAAFIVSPVYGTRCSTVLTIGYDGNAHFTERTFDPEGRSMGDVEFRFALTRGLTASSAA